MATTQWKKFAVERIPVKKISENEQRPFIEIVDDILKIKENNIRATTKSQENKIDLMTYKLYDLSYDKVKIVDPEIEKIISKKDYENFNIN